MFMILEELTLSKCPYYPKKFVDSTQNPYENTNDKFHRYRKNISKTYMES